MKEVTKKYCVYDFEELSESAKETVRYNYLNTFRDPDDYQYDCEDELIRSFTWSNLKVQFSLSYCQGDGVNIYGEISTLDAESVFVEQGIMNDELQKFFDMLRNTCGYFEINLPYNNRYSYGLPKKTTIREQIIDMLDEDQCDLWELEIIDFSDKLGRIIHTYEDRFEINGYDYFYAVNDDEIIEYQQENGYMYLPDGKEMYVKS